MRLRLLANDFLYKFIASLAVIIIAIFLFYPVKSFLIDGVLVPFVPIEVIFLDQTTLPGFLMAGALMIVVGLYCALGTELMGLTFVYLIENYALRVDILEIDFHELDALWEDTKSPATLAHRHMFLRNICRKYIDLRQYT